MIRHYFPGVDLDAVSDKELAELTNDAMWMHVQTMESMGASVANTVGMMFGGGKGGGKSSPPPKRPKGRPK